MTEEIVPMQYIYLHPWKVVVYSTHDYHASLHTVPVMRLHYALIIGQVTRVLDRCVRAFAADV